MTEAARRTFPSDMADQYTLRFPDGLRERIKEVAKENRRSMNAEIVFHLERIFHAPDAATGVEIGVHAPAAAEIETPPCRAASLVTTEREFRNDRT